jgi:hypothetical protein
MNRTTENHRFFKLQIQIANSKYMYNEHAFLLLLPSPEKSGRPYLITLIVHKKRQENINYFSAISAAGTYSSPDGKR